MKRCEAEGQHQQREIDVLAAADGDRLAVQKGSLALGCSVRLGHPRTRTPSKLHHRSSNWVSLLQHCDKSTPVWKWVFSGSHVIQLAKSIAIGSPVVFKYKA
jgi:hypothetical protein